MKFRQIVALAAAAALPAISAPASAAVQATAWEYTPGGLYGGLNVTSEGFSEGGTAGRFLGSYTDQDDGSAFQLYSYCLDILAPFYTYSDYNISPIANVLANATKQSQIAALVLNSDSAINSGATLFDRQLTAAGIQLAIWEVVYESGTSGYDVSSGNFSTYGDFQLGNPAAPNGDASARANTYLSYVMNSTWSGNVSEIRVLQSVGGTSQNQVYVSTPEPSTWMSMIAGFALAALGLRRRNTAAVPA